MSQISTAPSTEPRPRARPPARLAPPITRAVTALSVYEAPAVGSADPINPVNITLAMPTNMPQMTCAPMRVGISFTPLTNAVRSFAPIRRTLRKKVVREISVQSTNAATGTYRMAESMEEEDPQFASQSGAVPPAWGRMTVLSPSSTR
jgi:hypothetical protein